MNIKQARAKLSKKLGRHVTQRELADRLGYDSNHIAILERGERPMTKKLELLLELLLQQPPDDPT